MFKYLKNELNQLMKILYYRLLHKKEIQQKENGNQNKNNDNLSLLIGKSL